MTWRYEQLTGNIFHDAELVGVGYSGFAEGKDNPELQHVIDKGPIPVGMYRIGPAYDSQTHGPHVMELHPLPQTETFGRSGFLWHGDSKEHPGAASHGCICSSRVIRDEVSSSGDDLLQVFSGVAEYGP